tara:strand:- start:877 stop:1107 length:231 start_codon:yes stop_codon:yes gene_type:complete
MGWSQQEIALQSAPSKTVICIPLPQVQTSPLFITHLPLCKTFVPAQAFVLSGMGKSYPERQNLSIVIMCTKGAGED